MAKKRINLPFIVISLLVMALLAGGAYTLYRLRKNDPNRIIKIAEEKRDKGDMIGYASHLAGAANVKKDPALFVQSGDVYYGLTYENQDALSNAMQMYKAATQTDPGYVSAYEKLLKLFQEQLDWSLSAGRMKQDGVASLLTQMDDFAKAILRVEPDHAVAKRTLPMNVVTRSLVGIEIPSETVDQALATLEELRQKNPKDVDVLFTVAKMKLAAIARSSARMDAKQIQSGLDEAIKLVSDAADADPQNANLRAKVGQMCQLAIGATGKDMAMSEALSKRAVAEFDAARKILKADDENYVDISFASIQALEASRMFKADDAEFTKTINAQTDALLREVLKNKPTELSVRLALGRRLSTDPKTRDEGIELLKAAPPANVALLQGQRGITYKSNEIELKFLLLSSLIDRASIAPTPELRDATLTEADSYYQPLLTRFGEMSSLLMQRGRMELVKGQTTEAYSTLTKAYDKVPAGEQNFRNKQFLDLSFLLARVAILANAPGTAVTILEKMAGSNEAPQLRANPEVRIMLLTAYLKNNDKKGAETQKEFIRTIIKDRPDAAELYLTTLDPDKDAKEIKSTFDSLPETNIQFALAKAQIAGRLKLNDEMKRIFELIVQKNPKSAQGWILLSKYWQEVAKNKDKAIEVIATALKANPGDINLVFRQKELNNEDTSALVLGEIEKLPEGAQRQRALCDYYFKTNDEAKAIEAALAWEKAAPTDLDVKELLFNYYVRKGKYDQAQQYAPALAAANRDKSGGKLYEWTLLMSQQKYDQAQKVAAELTVKNPEFVQNWVALGQTLVAQAKTATDEQAAKSKYEEAIPKFNEALRLQGSNIDAFLGIIQCSEALQLYPDVRRYLERAVEKQPQNATFREMLNQFEVRHGDPEKAIEKRESDLKGDADNVSRYAALAEAYSAVAMAKAEKGDDAATTTYLQKAADVAGKAQQKWPDNPQLLNYYGALSVKLQKIDDAEKRWLAYAAGPGKEKPIPTALAFSNFYRMAGKLPEAEKVLRDQIKEQGDKPDTTLQLSLTQLLSSQNKLEEALEAIASGDSTRTQVIQTRIELLLRLNKIDDARKLIDESLAKTPSLELQALRGGLKISAGDDAGGMQDIKEVREKDPNNIAALIQASLRNYSKGETNDAIADLLRVRELLGDPSNPATRTQAIQVRLLLAEAYRRAGNVEACTGEMENALKLEPDNKTLRLQLVSMYVNGQPPRYSDSERLTREAHQIPAIAMDPDMLAAEAGMWSARKDHPRAVLFIDEAIKQAKDKPQQVTQLIAQKLQIMLAGRQFSQVIKFIDQQSSEFKANWWVMRDRATALYDGNKQQGIAAYSAVIDKVMTDKNIGAAASVLDAQIQSDNGNIDGAISMLGERVNANPDLKIVVIRLLAANNKLDAARKMSEELLAGLDQLPVAAQTGALQMAAQAWAQDPGRDEVKAQDAYLKLAKLRPDDFAVWNNLACLESLTPQQTLEYAQKAKDLMEKTGRVEPLVLDTYGAALLRAGKIDDAITYLTRAYQALKFREVCLHLADAYARRETWDSVEQYLREAQALYDMDVKEKRVDDRGAFQEKIIAIQKLKK